MPNSQGQPLPGEPGYVEPNTNGLLNNTPATQPAANTSPVTANSAPVAATASDATPTPFTVSPNQTVLSQIKNVVADDSPLLQQARTRAQQTANQRGLLNSSIAISAADAAVYDAALPIAQADAAAYDRAATNTAQAANQAALTNAQLRTGISQANATAANQQILQRIQSDTTLTAQDRQSMTQKYIADLDRATQEKIAGVQASTQLSIADKQMQTAALQRETQIQVANINAASSLANIDADGKYRTQIAGIQASYNTLIQTQASAGDLYKSMLATITEISSNPNVTDKATALNNAVKALNDGLGLLGDIQNLNLGSTLTFDGTPNTTEPAPVAPVVPASAPFLNGFPNFYDPGTGGTGDPE